MASAIVVGLAIGSLVGGGVCLATGVLAWRHRSIAATLPFVGVLIAAAAWSFANAGFLLAPTANGAYVAERVIRASATHVGPMWLVFVLAFTDRERWITRRNLAVLWVVPITYVAVSLTAPFHEFASGPSDVVLLTTNGLTAYFVPRGLASNLHLVFAFLTVLVGIGLLFQFLVASRTVYRKQVIALVVGTTMPAIAAAAADFGFLPHPGLDPTPIAFTATALLIGWALVRYGLLTVTPLAGDVLVDELPDPVFVLDEDDTVIDYNPAAETVFGVSDPAGDHVETVAPGLSDHLETGSRLGRTVGTGGDGEAARYYDPNVTPLENQPGEGRNRLVVLRDITGQQRRQQRLEVLQEATRQFLAASTDEEIAGICAEYTDEVLDSHGTAVFLADGGEELTPVAMTDGVADAFDRGEPADQPIAGTLARAHQDDELTTQELPGAVGGRPDRALAVPLGEHGVLWIGTQDEEAVAPDDEGFATILARTTQVALTRVERESALRQSRSSVERRSEQIAFFNGVLRHRLRNALLVIQGRAEHLRAEVGSDEEDHVDTIVDWCDDLAELSEEIRSVNDTVTATESERLDTVDLSRLLRKCVRRFEGEHDGVTFETDIDPGLRVQANELTTRVVDSLLENAVVHNDREDPHIEVWTVRAADRVQVHVADDGPGMDDAMKSTVFERDLSTNQTASGFGLYFISVLMNLYGGTVWFEDNHPRGTVAIVEFQAADGDDEDDNTTTSTQDVDAEVD